MKRFDFDIHEGDMRRYILLALAIFFVILNWGYSIDAIRHGVFSMLTLAKIPLSNDLQNQFSSTFIPLGHTVAHLILCLVLWLFFMWILHQFDLTKRNLDNEVTALRRANELLRDDLSQSNQLMESLNRNIDALLAYNSTLEKHRDRIVELGYEIEKIEIKKDKKNKGSVQNGAQIKEHDLFTRPKRKKTGPPRRSQKPRF